MYKECQLEPNKIGIPTEISATTGTFRAPTANNRLAAPLTHPSLTICSATEESGSTDTGVDPAALWAAADDDGEAATVVFLISVAAAGPLSRRLIVPSFFDARGHARRRHLRP
jgi:hypothetical protein